jgi:hypothetical protein
MVLFGYYSKTGCIEKLFGIVNRVALGILLSMLHKPISTARKAEERLTIMAREAEPKFLTAERKSS